MSEIIIYGTQYGTTKLYAEELSKKIHIPTISFDKIKDINKYEKIIYLGGLYAGGVLGMSKTLKKISDISSKKIIIVIVGLADPKDDENTSNIKNNIKRQLAKEILNNAIIFHLRGGIDYSKLNYIHKTMMRLLYKKVKNLPENKKTAEDKAMIETYNQKVNFIDFSSLENIISEIKK